MNSNIETINKITDLMSWVMRNNSLKNSITKLLERFVSTKSIITINGRLSSMHDIQMANGEEKIRIIFSIDYNEIEIKYTNSLNTTYKHIKKEFDEVIEITETDTFEQENSSDIITIEKYKKYINKKLVKSTHSKLLESEEQKSYSIHEELYVFKSGKGILKRSQDGEKKSGYNKETNYFETDKILNINFEKEEQSSIQEFEISAKEEHDKLYSKYLVSLLPVRCVNIVYKKDGKEKSTSVILFDANDIFIECIIDGETERITYEDIISISYGGDFIYKSIEEKEKIITINRGNI